VEASPVHVLWSVIAAALIAVGLVGAIVPVLPGIPLIFGGLWLLAGVDHYRHISPGWLLGIACVGAVGASRRAVWGALLGTVIGVFFGLPGLLLGPFFGALVGELSAGNSILRSAHVGMSAWAGLIFGTIVKLVSSVTMVALFGAVWWWHRSP
jgi:uncharacterized protein YqgC (DUF456 family)